MIRFKFLINFDYIKHLLRATPKLTIKKSLRSVKSIQQRKQSTQMQSSSPNGSHNSQYYGDEQVFDPLSTNETNLTSINTFLNSYQILKKCQQPIHQVKIYFDKQTQTHKKSNTPTNHIQIPSLINHVYATSLLSKDTSHNHLRKKEEKTIQLTKVVSKQQLNANLLSNSNHSLFSFLKIPNDNDLIMLNSNIKCSNLLNKIRGINNTEDLNKIPMFSYQEWKQVSNQIKKIFNKVFQTSMKELNTGTLISVKPNESLSIRTDYFCFHPHQVYTTLLALDKSDISSGSLAFCRLSKQFVQVQFPKFNDQFELLDKINKQRKQIEWQYLQAKQGNLIILGKDVIYGSFRNDSPNTKYFAQMRWVRHQSASNSSNSS